jgi:RNA polymerase sigma factor (sigma-70 family)
LFGFKKTYSEKDLVQDCLAGKKAAQQALYDRYSPTMFATCLRYIGNEMEAEEIMVNGFLKVFANIASFREDGSFEGWIRRIMINEALTALRKRRLSWIEPLENARHQAVYADSDLQFEAEELLQMIDELPTGYRTVFNLYGIEGYSHKEIAEMLEITESTSKSQLNRARAMLQKMIQKSAEIEQNRLKHTTQNIENIESYERP